MRRGNTEQTSSENKIEMQCSFLIEGGMVKEMRCHEVYRDPISGINL